MQLEAITFTLLSALGLYRGKIIHSCHGLDLESHTDMSTFEKRLFQWMCRRADAVVACSVALKQRFLDIVDKSAGYVQVIHNGVDYERLLRITETAGDGSRRSHRDYILTVATFEKKRSGFIDRGVRNHQRATP